MDAVSAEYALSAEYAVGVEGAATAAAPRPSGEPGGSIAVFQPVIAVSMLHSPCFPST